MALVHDPNRVVGRIALTLQDERISRSPREVMAATMNNRTIMPYSVTIHKAEATNEIILIRLNSNVDTDHVTLQLSTGLFYT